MIDAVLIQYLSKALRPVPVSAQVPVKKPKRFVTVERTGMSLGNHIYTTTFAIQSNAETLIEAAALDEDARQAMLDAVKLDGITAVRLNSSYNFTDPDSEQMRFQSVFDVTHY